MGLQPDWVTSGGMFAVTIDGNEHYINFARSPLNSHTSASLAKNKYLTRRILERHNIDNIPFARPQKHADAESFLLLHQKIVAKPVAGSGARNIHIITTTDQLRDLELKKYIFEKYITGWEVRYLILDGVVIGVHRSEYGASVAASRPLQRISYPPTAWNQELVSSSLRIASILDLNFAAVDYLVETSGHAYVLEVNSAPGLKWFHAPTQGPAVDVAGQFLETIRQLKKVAL